MTAAATERPWGAFFNGTREGMGQTDPALLLSNLARLYAKNRRDGARLLSSALVITSIGLIRIDHPIGQAVAALGTLVCLYWWSCYRTLER